MPKFQISVSATTILRYEVEAADQQSALSKLRETDDPDEFFIGNVDLSPDFNDDELIDIEQCHEDNSD